MPDSRDADFGADARMFGQRFKQQRGIAGLSKDQIAKELGLSIEYLSLIEAGTANPTLETMVMLADAVGTEVWNLLVSS